MVTRLTFDDASYADEELAELERHTDTVKAIEGFRSLLAFKPSPTEVIIVRVFDRADQLGRSLGPLRPDLAEHFAAPPVRAMGSLRIAEIARD